MDIEQFYYYCWNEMPSEPQAKFLELVVDPSKPRIVSTAGAQTGKTKACATAVVYLSLFYPGINLILVSAQFNWIYYHACQIFSKHPEFKPHIITPGINQPIPKYGYSLKNGSICHLCSSTEASLRGAKADFVFLDETALIPHRIFLECMDRISGNWSKLVLVSTAEGKHERWLLELIDQRKKRDWEWITWSAEDCPWHKKETLKMKMEEFGKARYKIMVQGLIPSKAERPLFRTEDIENCISREVHPEGGPRICGVDFGESRGATTAIVVEKNRSRMKVLEYKLWSKKHIEETAPEIAKLSEKWNCVIIQADSKPVHFQKQIEKHTRTKVTYIDPAFSKSEQLGQLARYVKTHHLELGENMIDLISQLKKYRRGLSQGDDIVDGLALACFELRQKPTTKAVCRIV